MNRDLILIEKTQQDFGYSPLELTIGSTKYIWHKCVVCDEPKKNRFRLFVRQEGISHRRCKRKLREQTNLKKYGVKNPSQCKRIQQKREQTFLQKYGTKTPAENKKVKQRMQQTCLQRYGVKNVFQNKQIQKKQIRTNLKKYGVKHLGNLRYELKTKEYWLRQDFGGCRINPNQDLPDRWSQGSTQKLEIVCLCGKIWTPYFHDLTSERIRSCKKCYFYSKTYWLKQDFNSCRINPDQDLPDQWSQGCNQKFEIVCSCQKMFTPQFHDLVSGRHKSCGHFSQSQGEKQLGEYLEQLFSNQITSQDNLGFLGRQKVDFANRSLNLAFEYDGEQHYNPIKSWGGEKTFRKNQQRDKRKEKLLKQNGWILIRIKYDKDIKQQLTNALEKCRLGRLA